MAEDIKNLDIEYYQRVDAIGNLLGVFVSSPAVTRVLGGSGTYPVISTVNLVHLDYGAPIVARVRAVDYSGNASPWSAFSNEIVLSQVLTPDLGANAVATISYFTSDADNGLAPFPSITLLGQLAIQTIGKSVDITVKIGLKDSFGADPHSSADPSGSGGIVYLTRGETWAGPVGDPGSILDSQFGSGMLIAVDTIPPGVWVYSVWGTSNNYITGGSVCDTCRMKVQENRGGFS